MIKLSYLLEHYTLDKVMARHRARRRRLHRQRSLYRRKKGGRSA
jgi:hypothetical protein